MKNKLEIVGELINIRKQLRDVSKETNDIKLKFNLLRCMKDLRFSIDYYFEGERDMNKARRMRLTEAKSLLEQANDIINDVMNEEDNAFNNLSEGLQQTMRGEQMEDNIGEMEDVIDNIEEAISGLENIE